MSASQNRVFPPVEVISSIENHLEVEETTSAYEGVPLLIHHWKIGNWLPLPYASIITAKHET